MKEKLYNFYLEYIYESHLWFFYHNRILRIWCWLIGHDYSKPFGMYGVPVKFCERCFKYKYLPIPKKIQRIMGKSLCKGEISQIFGVRFVDSFSTPTQCKPSDKVIGKHKVLKA